jgi:hypothetical protein
MAPTICIYLHFLRCGVSTVNCIQLLIPFVFCFCLLLSFISNINPLTAIHVYSCQMFFASSLPPSLIPLSGVGTICFSSCCDKDSAIIFTTGRLPSTLFETGVGANDCKCYRDQRFNVPSEARRSSR